MIGPRPSVLNMVPFITYLYELGKSESSFVACTSCAMVDFPHERASKHASKGMKT